jgi:hypothetical protein
MIALVLTIALAQPPKADSPPEKKPEPDAKPLKQTKQGVTVSIEEVAVGKARLMDVLGDKVLSESEHLLVAIIIHNGSETKKLDYQGWCEPFGFPLPHLATVTDEFDNTLKRSAFGLTTRLIGQLQNVSIYPGKTVRDVLAFERPIDKCESVRLLLPGEAIGLDESFVFDIPSSAWKPKPVADPWKKKKEPAKKAPVKPVVKPKPKPEKESPIESIVLLSVVGSGDTAKAMVRLLPSKRTTTVAAGQKLGNWKIDSIDDVRETIVVVDSKGERKRLRKAE